MATTRTKPSPKRKQPTAKRKPTRSSSAARRRKASPRKATTSRHLPDWKDLGVPRKRKTARVRTLKRQQPHPLSTARFLAALLVVATACTIYVGHIYDTQDLYAEVQQLRRQNLRLNLKYNRLKGEFDRATGPNTIYQRARALGLKDNLAYGPVIKLNSATE